MKKKISKVDIIYIVLFAAFILILTFGKYFTPYDPNEIDMSNRFAGFSSKHLLGTDSLGRDVFSRIIAGGQTSVFTSFIILIISLVAGVSLGLMAGYFGGKVDWFIMRIVDTCMVFPSTIIAIIISGILGGGTLNVIIAIAMFRWFKYCRVSRSIIISEKEKEYIMAAKIDGVNSAKILFKHLLPYVTGNVIALAIVDVGRTILTVASMSYLGFGIQIPNAEWGLMLNEGRAYFSTHPITMIIPGLAIFLAVMIFNFFGNRVEKMFNIKEKAGD